MAYKQQEFIFHSSEGKVQGQGAGRFLAQWGSIFWFTDSCLFDVLPWGFFSWGDWSYSWGLYPCELITPQRPYLPIPTLGVRFQHTNFGEGGHKYSFYGVGRELRGKEDRKGKIAWRIPKPEVSWSTLKSEAEKSVRAIIAALTSGFGISGWQPPQLLGVLILPLALLLVLEGL